MRMKFSTLMTFSCLYMAFLGLAVYYTMHFLFSFNVTLHTTCLVGTSFISWLALITFLLKYILDLSKLPFSNDWMTHVLRFSKVFQSLSYPQIRSVRLNFVNELETDLKFHLGLG